MSIDSKLLAICVLAIMPLSLLGRTSVLKEVELIQNSLKLDSIETNSRSLKYTYSGKVRFRVTKASALSGKRALRFIPEGDTASQGYVARSITSLGTYPAEDGGMIEEVGFQVITDGYPQGYYQIELIVSPPFPTPSSSGPPPWDLVPAGAEANQIELRWQNQPGHKAGYVVERSEGSWDSPWAEVRRVNANASGYVDQTVLPGKLYLYRVRAYSAHLVSQPGNVARAATAPKIESLPPRKVFQVWADAKRHDEIHLRWNGITDSHGSNVVSGLACYHVYRNDSLVGITTGKNPHTTSAMFRHYADRGLSPSTQYSYKIVSVDAAGNPSEPSSPIEATTLEWDPAIAGDVIPPPKPEGLVISPVAGKCLSMRYTLEYSASLAAQYGIVRCIWYRDGEAIASSPYLQGALNPSFGGFFLPNHTYRLQAAYLDAAGNRSKLSDSISFTTPDASQCGVYGAVHTKVILINFPDHPQQPFSRAHADSTIFLSEESMKALVGEASFGRASLEGSVSEWITLPQPVQNYCGTINANGLGFRPNITVIMNDAFQVLGEDYDASQTDLVILVCNGIATAGQGGENKMLVSATNGFTIGTMIHEAGHALGELLHAGTWNTQSAEDAGLDINDPGFGTAISRYGDPYDPMGSGEAVHFSAFNKRMLGWIDSSQVRLVETGGTFVIDQVEQTSSGIKELLISVGKNAVYTIDYQSGNGFNDTTGVQIRLHPGYYPGTDATTIFAKSITMGQAFSDPFQKIQIECISLDSHQATVKVTML